MLYTRRIYDAYTTHLRESYSNCLSGNGRITPLKGTIPNTFTLKSLPNVHLSVDQVLKLRSDRYNTVIMPLFLRSGTEKQRHNNGRIRVLIEGKEES